MAPFVLPLSFAIVVLSFPALTQAQSRVLVQNFQGPRAAAIRGDAVRGLRGQNVAVLPRSNLSRAARRMRLRMRRDRDFARAGRALHADVFVQGRVRRRRGWHLTLTVRDGSTGQVVARSTISARNPRVLGNQVRARFWGVIAGALDDGGRGTTAVASSDDMVFELTEAEPTTTRTAEARAVEEREQSVEEELDSIRRQNLDGELFPTAMDDEVIPALQTAEPFVAEHSPGDVRLGAGFVSRKLVYRDDVRGTELPHVLPMGAVFGFSGELYPAALFTNNAWAHIALTFEGSHSAGMTTAGPNVTYDTRDTTWGFGTRGRIGLGESELGLSLGFVQHSFSIEERLAIDGAPPIASVSYSQLLLGVDTRVRVGDFAVYGAFAYRPVLDVGEINDDAYYPGATAHGVSFDLGVGYPLPFGFEVRADMGAEIYFLNFHADPTVIVEVGGAVDRYINGTLKIVWHMGPLGF